MTNFTKGNAHVLLKCKDCGAKSWCTRECVDLYLRPDCTLITCPKCGSAQLDDVHKEKEPTLADALEAGWRELYERIRAVYPQSVLPEWQHMTNDQKRCWRMAWHKLLDEEQ